MVLWRVSNYATLDGTGGLYAAGRWHTRGHLVVYCCWNPATALLESLVHLEIAAEDQPASFQVLKIEAPDHTPLESATLPPGWQDDPTLTQQIGDSWLSSRRTPLLQVPSILVPETFNVLINPLHPDAPGLRILKSYQHPFDPRLLV